MGDLSNDDDDRRFFGGLCPFPLLPIFIAIIVVIAFVFVTALFIIIPKDPILTFTNASLNQFNFTPATNALDYNLALNLSFRNPNKRAGISYRGIQVIGVYRYEKFANVKLNSTPFYQDHENTTALPTLLLQGQKSVKFMKWDISKYNSQTAAGVYRIDLKIRLRLRYNRVKLIKRIKRWPLICCELEVPLNRLNGTSAGGFTAMCKRNRRRNRCL